MDQVSSTSKEVGEAEFSSLAYKTLRLFGMVLIFEALGLLGAFLFAGAISYAAGSEDLQSYPWSTVLAVDFFFIAISAVLAELAVPSRTIDEPFAELMFTSVTSFIIAIGTLAPLASYASQVATRQPPHATILSAVITNPQAYLYLVIGVVLACLTIAALNAITIRRVSRASTTPKALVEDQYLSVALRVQPLVLLGSIIIFSAYTFFVHPWDAAGRVPLRSVVWALIGGALLLASICVVAMGILYAIRGFSHTVNVYAQARREKSGTPGSEPKTAYRVLHLLLSAIVPAILWFVLIAILATLVFPFVRDYILDNTFYVLAAFLSLFLATMISVLLACLVLVGMLSAKRIKGWHRDKTRIEDINLKEFLKERQATGDALEEAVKAFNRISVRKKYTPEELQPLWKEVEEERERLVQGGDISSPAVA